MIKMTPLELHIETKERLYKAYLSFVAGGGLFIQTVEPYDMGQEIWVKVYLLQEIKPYEVRGQVIWMTPREAQDNRPSGIGIQLLPDFQFFSTKIECLLGEQLNATQLTDTL